MTDLLELRSVEPLVQSVQEIILLEPASDTHIIEVPEPQTLLEPTGGTQLIEPVERVVLLEVAKQGPPGIQGQPGQAGVGYVTYLAQGPISGHRVVCAAFSLYVRYADSSDVGDATAVLGITLNASEDNDPINVATSGEIVEPSWAWAEGLPIFVGVAGVLTQIPPVAGFQLVVGVATSPTTILVGIKQPIIL